MASPVFERDFEVSATDFATGLFRGVEDVAGDGQLSKFVAQHFQRQARVNQRAEQHIAAGPADGLDVGDAHI